MALFLITILGGFVPVSEGVVSVFELFYFSSNFHPKSSVVSYVPIFGRFFPIFIIILMSN